MLNEWALPWEQGRNYELVTDSEFNKQEKEVEKSNMLIKSVKSFMTLYSVLGTEIEPIGFRRNTRACSNWFDGHIYLNSDYGLEKYVMQIKTTTKNDIIESENRGGLFHQKHRNGRRKFRHSRQIGGCIILDRREILYIRKVIELDSFDNTVF